MISESNIIDMPRSTTRKCFICYKESGVESIQDSAKNSITENPFSEISTSTLENISELNQGSEENMSLKSHMAVIFFLRKFVGLPKSTCTSFLEKYGNPSSWIYWCDNCSFFVDEAKPIFKTIAILEKKLEALRDKLKDDVIRSEKLENNSVRNNVQGYIQSSPSEIVRAFIRKDDENFLVDFTPFTPLEVKLEVNSNKEVEEICRDLDICSAIKTEKDIPSDSDYDVNFDIGNEYSSDVSFTPAKTPSKQKATPQLKKNVKSTSNSKKPHKCELCSKGLSTLKHLRRHLRAHPPPCNYCEEQFLTKTDFQDHMTTNHKDEELKNNECTVCGDVLQNFEEVFNHNCRRMRFKCSQCGMSFHREDMMKKHEMSHNGPRPYQCTLCEKSFSSSYSLKCHEGVHEDPKRYSCCLCPTSFTVQNDLKRHMERKHATEKNFICGICGRAFAVLAYLKTHEKVHAETKPFQCEQCGKGFLTKRRLTTHILVHTGERPYKCDYCETAYREKNELTKHLRTHTGEKPYVCKICGKRMAYGLGKHMHRHKGTRYPCNVCGKHFSTCQSKNEHQMIHTGEKPFKCTKCEKAYRSKKDLQIHDVIHSGVKSFLCPVCGKGYYFSKNMTLHLKTHSDEPLPYPCSYCDQRFINSTRVRQHEMKHTGEKRYVCPNCGRGFTRTNHLKKHKCVVAT